MNWTAMTTPEEVTELIVSHGMCGVLSPAQDRVCIKEPDHNDQHGWDVESDPLVLMREALLHYMRTYTTCPCGAWVDRLEARPHVIGCPVAIAMEVPG